MYENNEQNIMIDCEQDIKLQESDLNLREKGNFVAHIKLFSLMEM